ncbi:hypothetical protein [Lacipirellula parvula]|uniref:Uncharacterized protein n=1 Tax=Lacipirellula parvula TaxID=2650471 RepID=A0A5K7X4S2_9BACT|nr:hypothetical protein [Lacipirellula parvula]BBO31540.1 hypothetical protein PLANPX_1152 [Lacipirellula parvula]
MNKSNHNEEDAGEGESAASRSVPRRGAQRVQSTNRSSKARRRRASTIGGIHQRTNKRSAW